MIELFFIGSIIINILNGKSSAFMRIFGLLKLFLKKFKNAKALPPEK